MLAIFGFLLTGAASTVVLLQRKWAPKVNDVASRPAEAETGAAIEQATNESS